MSAAWAGSIWSVPRRPSSVSATRMARRSLPSGRYSTSRCSSSRSTMPVRLPELTSSSRLNSTNYGSRIHYSGLIHSMSSKVYPVGS